MSALRASLLSTLGRAPASAPSTPPGAASGSPKTGKASKGKCSAASAAPAGTTTAGAGGGSPAGSPLVRFARDSPRPSVASASSAPKVQAWEPLKLSGVEDARRSVASVFTRSAAVPPSRAGAASRDGLRIEMSPANLIACGCLPGEQAAVFLTAGSDASGLEPPASAAVLVGPAWPSRALSDGQVITKGALLPGAIGHAFSTHDASPANLSLTVSDGAPVAVRRVQPAPAALAIGSRTPRSTCPAAVWEADLLCCPCTAVSPATSSAATASAALPAADDVAAVAATTAAAAGGATAAGAAALLDPAPWCAVVAWLVACGALDGIAGAAEVTRDSATGAEAVSSIASAGAAAASSSASSLPLAAGSCPMWSLPALMRAAEIAATVPAVKTDAVCPPVAVLRASLARWMRERAAASLAADASSLWLRLRPRAGAVPLFVCADAPAPAMPLFVLSRGDRIVAAPAASPPLPAAPSTGIVAGGSLPPTASGRTEQLGGSNSRNSSSVTPADLAVDEGLRQLLLLVKSSLLAPQAYTAYGLSPPR